MRFQVPKNYQTRLEIVAPIDSPCSGEYFLIRPPGNVEQVAEVFAFGCTFTKSDIVVPTDLFIMAQAMKRTDYERHRNEVVPIVHKAQAQIINPGTHYPPCTETERAILNERMCEVALAALALRFSDTTAS